MKDLSTFDAAITFPPIFGIGHISLMCVLMTITTLLTTWYNNATAGATANNQMKYIGYIMPLLFFFVLNSFPACINFCYVWGADFICLTLVINHRTIYDHTLLSVFEEHKIGAKAMNQS